MSDKTEMKCFPLQTTHHLECTSVDGVKYCEKKEVKREVCLPYHGNDHDLYERLQQVLKGLNESR